VCAASRHTARVDRSQDPACVLQKPMSMMPSNATPRILVIRAWTEPLVQFRAALRDAGVTVRITRVDIEPALNAALARSSYDAVVWDPACAITRDIVEARLREHGRTATIVVLEELGVTVTNIVHTLTARFN
jgi:hypothetical protein